MGTPRPLFVTGPARSGSTLLCMMLSAHPEVMVASDPYLTLFRSLRNAIVRERTRIEIQKNFDPSTPIQDYYFSDELLEIMNAIQASDLDITFNKEEWTDFTEICLGRTRNMCPDLVPLFGKLLGSTYKDIFDNALSLIAEARDSNGRKWVGFKEVWTIEFFAAMGRSYPDARFIVLLRDPRAIVASMLALGDQDQSQAAHTLSYLRQWRKYVAFALRYQHSMIFKNRIMVLNYEELLRNPEEVVSNICNFLSVRFDSAMLDTNCYFDYSTRTKWTGNSSFEKQVKGLQSKQTERWQTKLTPDILRLIDLICGPDMNLMGYASSAARREQWPDPMILEYLMRNARIRCSWRSDFADPQRDYGYELFRRALLDLSGNDLDDGVVRRSFLFKEVFLQLQENALAAKCA